jgi:hypothetical protein
MLQEPDKPHNRLGSSSDAATSRTNEYKKNAAKVAKASKSAARASKAYKARKRPYSSSNDFSSSDYYSDARRFRLNTAHVVSSALRADAAHQSSRIILDSGASTHMRSHETWFKFLRSRKRNDILLGDVSSIACKKEGTIHFSMGFRGKVMRFTLEKCSVHTWTETDPIFTQCASFCELRDSVHRRPLLADRLQDSRWTGNNCSQTATKRHILCACCGPHQTATCRSLNRFEFSNRRRQH